MNEPIKTKNTMPSFTRGTLGQLKKALSDKKIVPPAFHFLTEDNKKCLAFVDIDGIIYQINLDRIEKLESDVSMLTSQMEGLKDPETGEPIKVTEYVQPTIEAVQEIQKNGAAIMITSTDIDNGGDS